MNNRPMMYRKEDRTTLKHIAVWIECMMLLSGSILLGILLLA